VSAASARALSDEIIAAASTQPKLADGPTVQVTAAIPGSSNRDNKSYSVRIKLARKIDIVKRFFIKKI